MRSRACEVLLLIEGEIATTQLLERVLAACRPTIRKYEKRLAGEVGHKDFGNSQVPLLVRCADPGTRLWIELLVHAELPYVYYLDDNFWELRGDSPIARYYQAPEVRATLELAVTNAFRVITNSEVLAEYLRKFNGEVRVLPAFFDFQLLDGAQREITDEIRIGFAGSPTRGADLDLIRPALARVLEEIPNAVFEFAGVMPAGVEPGPRIRFFEHMSSYEQFVQFQVGRNWAIGLAPLLDTPSNRAKTNNKFREYGACRIAGVYSNLAPYHGCVEDGITGLFAGQEGASWYEAIIALATNRERRERIADAAERRVRADFSVEAVAEEWSEVLSEAQEELHRRPSHLRRVYLQRIMMRRTAREIRILGLQIQDAYQKGGVGLVTEKSIQRIGGWARRLMTGGE